MNLSKYFDRFERLHRMIGKSATGSPAELAEKLQLSRRTVFEYIRIMREMGAPIAFCPIRQTYYYERLVIFKMGFCELKEEKSQSIKEDASSVDLSFPMKGTRNP